MKIAQKLGLLVGALLAALLLTILVLSAQVAATSREYNSLIDNEIQQRADSVTMLVNFNKQVLDYQQILLQADTEDEYVALKKVYDAQIELVDKLTDQLLSNVGPEDPRLRTSLQQFKTTHTALDAQYQASLDSFRAGGLKQIATASAAVQNVENFPNDLVANIVDYRQKSVDKLIKDQSAAAAERLRIIYGVSALLLLIATIAVTAMVRGIVRPVRALTVAALDAANQRLPKVVAEIATLPADAPTPSLPRFEVTTKDELAELASALSTLQDSAVALALEQRRNEEANAETLVNLGRRNQSLLTRMLSYVTELERNERDSEALDKLFRLDHLTTRIRRNAESLLVLAGAKQTRTWSHPIAIDDVLQAALSEIEEYTRVTVHHMDHAKVHGSVAADLTHMIAELLENGTRFSPREQQVLVVGRLTPSGYQFDLIDAGLGMEVEELNEANLRISQAGQRRPDTKVLGHHVVGRIASRRGIFVQLLPSDQVGLTAMVLVPVALLSDAAIPATLQDITEVPMINPIPVPTPAPVRALTLAPAPTRAPAPAPSRAPAPAAASAWAPNPAPAPAVPLRASQPPVRMPARVAASDLAPVAAERPVPGRRVRGAQLGDLGAQDREHVPAPVDPHLVRSQMSALQSGVSAARRDQHGGPMSASIPQPPTGSLEQLPPVPTRRVRGAQLAELGADAASEVGVPVRDPSAIGRQLAGLQAATTRASRENGRYPAKDDETHGSNA
jgi:methyl-accepting chemotaxis protein